MERPEPSIKPIHSLRTPNFVRITRDSPTPCPRATPWVSWFAAAAIAVVVGCGQSGPVRAPIQGKVTVGGQPLAAGRILFTPLAPNSGPATSAMITAGEYTIPQADGPVVGKNRVEVEAQLNLGFAIDDEAAFAKRGGKPLPPNPIPPQFNRESQLVVEVVPGDANTFNIEVPKSRHTTARPAF